MGLEIGAIERSRRVDSQAWCFFFSTQKIRDARAPQSRIFRKKTLHFAVRDEILKLILEYLFIEQNCRMSKLCTLMRRDGHP